MPSLGSRHTFRFTCILILAALGTGLAAVGGWRYARASAPVNGPIVLISVDTLRADHLPVYGYRKIRTPAIDALARDGVVFERAYSHAPQTLPSHASLLSGRLPFETGVRDDVGFVVKSSERLLPQMLRERGYTTGGIVSADVLGKETGIKQGFDFFDDEVVPPDEPVGAMHRDGAESEAIAEHWLGAQGSSRVFLFLHLYEPHKPYAPPARFAEYSPYDGEIAYVDEIVSRLIKYLKTHQLYDRSTIVLLSDHGEGLGDHGEQEHGLFVYEEAIHVPLIIKPEAGVGAGRRVTDLVQHIDIVPTILDLAKAPIPGHLRGRSLKPLLDGTGRLPERAIYSEALYGRYHFGWSELAVLTDGRYRYIRAPREELYDLEQDPRERHNIAEHSPDLKVQHTLRDALDRLIAPTTISAPAEVSAEDREQLQTPGYVGAQPGAAGETLPDPKDQYEILETFRAAVDAASDYKWGHAIGLLQQILRRNPGIAEVWTELATVANHADRPDLAVDAYNHVIDLRPADVNGYLGAATVLFKARKFDEARERAERGAEVAVERDMRSRASAHELLTRIALGRHDVDGARREAELTRQADATLPMPTYVEARLLYDRQNYDEALPLFQQAAADLQQSPAQRLVDLHFHTADTLVRLGRSAEAELEFIEELRDFPRNTRARSGLAMLYHTTGRPDQATTVVTDLIRTTPTPDAYALAARLLTTFGHRKQADAVRAEARNTFTPPRTTLPDGKHKNGTETAR